MAATASATSTSSACCITASRLKNLAQQVNDERNNRDDDQDMEGKGCDMEDQKAAQPKQKKNDRQY